MDQLVVVASAAIPVTDPFLIDRVSAIAALKGCGVVVCVNKIDLAAGEELCLPLLAGEEDGPWLLDWEEWRGAV